MKKLTQEMKILAIVARKKDIPTYEVIRKRY